MSLISPSPATCNSVLERVAGIEPASSAWKAEVIASIRHPRIPFVLTCMKTPYLTKESFRGWTAVSGPIILHPFPWEGWIAKCILHFALPVGLRPPSRAALARVRNRSRRFRRTGAARLVLIRSRPTPTLSQGLKPLAKGWWRGVDSNHRRQCQQIYSLSPLATREPLQQGAYSLHAPGTCQ